MYFARLIARQWGLATVLGMAALVGQVQAQTSPAQALDDGSTSTFLKLDNASSHNYFVRFGYTYFKPNTKAGPVYDVTGPAIGYQQALNQVRAGKLKDTNGVTCTPGTFSNVYGNYNWGGSSICQSWGRSVARILDDGLEGDQVSGMGIPPVLYSNASGAGLFTVQAGMFFDEEHKWSVEPFVFGIPPENKVYVTGPNSLSGQLAITTQQLPLTVILNRYFGDKNARLRASLGLGATYAIFFNSQATAAMNNYAGGETDVKINNAFGYGPFAGLQVKLADRWHLSAQVGYVKLKTTATLTTHDTKLTDGTTLSAVVKDFTTLANGASGPNGGPGTPYYWTAGALCTLICTTDVNGLKVYDPTSSGNQKIAAFLDAIQKAQGGNLGTYSRRQDVSLDPYVFSLAVGYEF